MRSSTGRANVWAVVAIATLGAAMAGCGGEPATPTAIPTAERPAATGSPTPVGPTATRSNEGTASIVVDATLLDSLPNQIAGVPLQPDAETAADVAADPSLSVSVERLAVATAFGPLATDGAADYAVVTVAGLRPGAFSDGFFRDWRDTFDTAVCEQAGGVTGHAEATLGEHRVWIGTCSGGVHTYHATLHDDTVIVSSQGAGPGRFGELIMAGLTE